MVIIFDKISLIQVKITLFSAPETTKIHRGARIIRLLYNFILDATVCEISIISFLFNELGGHRSTSMDDKRYQL